MSFFFSLELFRRGSFTITHPFSFLYFRSPWVSMRALFGKSSQRVCVSVCVCVFWRVLRYKSLNLLWTLPGSWLGIAAGLREAKI